MGWIFLARAVFDRRLFPVHSRNRSHFQIRRRPAPAIRDAQFESRLRNSTARERLRLLTMRAMNAITVRDFWCAVEADLRIVAVRNCHFLSEIEILHQIAIFDFSIFFSTLEKTNSGKKTEKCIQEEEVCFIKFGKIAQCFLSSFSESQQSHSKDVKALLSPHVSDAQLHTQVRSDCFMLLHTMSVHRAFASARRLIAVLIEKGDLTGRNLLGACLVLSNIYECGVQTSDDRRMVDEVRDSQIDLQRLRMPF
jgi:hypothetical protein